jgi:anti-anti-sigma factor
VRRTGEVQGGSGLRLGDHVCWTYATDDEHRRVLTTFFAEGAAAGEQLVYFASPETEEVVRTYVTDPDSVHVDLVDDPDVRASHIERLARNAPAGVRVATESAWLAARSDLGPRLPAAELRTDLVTARVPAVVLCGYDLRICDDAVILDAVAAVHPLCSRARASGDGPLFHLHAADDGGISLTGEVDATQSELVESLLVASMDQLREPVIDVSALDFVDVSGMRAVANAAADLQATRQRAEVRGASPTFRKVWSLLGYDDLTPTGTP